MNIFTRPLPQSVNSGIDSHPHSHPHPDAKHAHAARYVSSWRKVTAMQHGSGGRAAFNLDAELHRAFVAGYNMATGSAYPELLEENTVLHGTIYDHENAGKHGDGRFDGRFDGHRGHRDPAQSSNPDASPGLILLGIAVLSAVVLAGSWFRW